MSDVKELTADEEEILARTRKEWDAFGASTEPMNFDAAKNAIIEAYEVNKLAAPSAWYKAGSPMCGATIAGIMVATDDVFAWDRVVEKMGKDVNSILPESVWSEAIYNVDGFSAGELRDSVRSQINSAVWGSLECPWMAFYEAFRKMNRIRGIEPLIPLMGAAREAGWWWPFANVCIISDRPSFISRDEDGNLHHQTRAALEYRDGWQIHSFHGHRVPKKVIEETMSLTPSDIEQETNSETRRIMLTLRGFEWYARERGAKIVHEDELHGQPRKLMEIIVNGDRLRYIDVFNGTVESDGSRRQFFLQIPVDINTCHDAVAWSYGIRQVKYKEGIRT